MSSARSHSLSRLSIVALFVVGRLSVGLLAGQSLADVAKKEEDRRKTVASPAKVYTNKDLNPVPAGSPPAATPAKPGEPAAKPADGDAKGSASKPSNADDKTVVKDQKYWAGRLKTLNDDVLRDENYADAMQTRINALTTDFVNRDDPAQRAVIEQNRQKSIAELARLKKSVQDSKKAIADLLEEARNAGVPPGWMR
jgi:hypothetical protein